MREMITVSTPLLIIGAGILVSTILGARREAWKRAQEPRVEVCALRAPTPEERYLGAKIGLTIRTNAPETPQFQPSYSLKNSRGQMWSNSNFIGGSYVSSDGDNRTIVERSGGLNWQQMSPRGEKVSATVELHTLALVALPAKRRLSRTFELKLPATPFRTPQQETANVSIVGAKLRFGNTTGTRGGFGPELLVRSRCSQHFEVSSIVYVIEPLIQNRGDDAEFFANTSISSQSLEEGLRETTIQGVMPKIKTDWKRPCKIRGLINASGGWPLEITLDLPRGFDPTAGEQTLQFSTGLASPKKIQAPSSTKPK